MCASLSAADLLAISVLGCIQLLSGEFSVSRVNSKRCLYTFVTSFICLFLSVFVSQQAALATEPAAIQSEAYPTIASDHPYTLAKAKILQQAPDSDFHQLRLAFTDTPRYKPYFGSEEALEEPVFSALQSDEFALCVESVERLLDYNYASIPGHFAAMRCHEGLNEDEPASFHRWVLDGLLDDVRSRGHGQSPEQSFITYSVNELHWVLNLFGLIIKEQGILSNETGVYDQVKVTQHGSDEVLDLYFDVSVQMSRGLSWADESDGEVEAEEER